MKNKINIGIIGVSGYTGLELIKILSNHTEFKINYIANTSGKGYLWDIYPNLIKVCKNLKIDNINLEKIKSCKLVFLALPHEASMKIVPKILDLDVKIIDLSADYRLKKSNFESNYTKHSDSKNLKNAVYGLIEWNKEKIKNANLIANPGCYPTASLLGILPFLEYLNDTDIFIDAKSGVSGAGKKLSDNTHYPNINDNIFSYSPFTHRHQIEISEKCEFFGKKKLNINFVPHLCPFTRGILVSIFAKIKEKINPIEILNEIYKNEESIRIKNYPVNVKDVSGTHFCDIFAKTNNNVLYINTSIDNLLRGASSQAIASANIMFGFDDILGLPRIAYVP